MSTLPVPQLGSRTLFSTLKAKAYLNHAGISPPSDAVRAALNSFVEHYAREGSSGFGIWLEQRTRLRGMLARLLGARPEELAFVPNTSGGMSSIALSFPWSPGDRLVTFRGEFPANVTPWQQAAKAFGLEHRMLSLEAWERGAEEGLSELERELARGRVRLVAVSLVQFQTGLRMPVERMAELCHAHGAQLFVDAVQAAGIVPIDVGTLGADYLSAGGHKWLMGLEGAGVLWVRAERLVELRPNTASWLSHEDPVSFLLHGEGLLRYDRPMRARADYLEGGGPNAAGLAALEGSVRPLLELGVGAIFDHVQDYLDRLEPELILRGFSSERKAGAARSGILAVRPPADISLSALSGALGERGVVMGTPDGRLRVSPHWPNSLAELPALLEAIDASLGALRTAPTSQASNTSA